VDPWHFGTDPDSDPDPDPALFVRDLRDAKRNNLYRLFLLITF
jgi:hypothetical protein